MEKIEIIYAFNGFVDPKIRDVKVSRVNGYETKIIKEGEEKMVTEYKLKDISGADIKQILELVDQKDVSIEDILSFLKKFIKRGKGGKSEMINQTDDERRFSAEEIIVEKYLEDHKGENLTYRDAVVACLDRTEPVKKEFSEDEKQFIQKEKENLEKIEEYLESHPGTEYRTACLTVLGKDELTENEKKIEEFIEKRRKQGIEVSYREAVLTVLDRSEPKEE